jgi:hypothetical protein
LEVEVWRLRDVVLDDMDGVRPKPPLPVGDNGDPEPEFERYVCINLAGKTGGNVRDRRSA